MNDIQLYVKEPTDVNYTRLDLFKDETISLTQTIQDVKDPGKIFTNFSKTFSLPASKTNNKFFKHYENFIQSSEYSFDARKKKEAKIELNSLPFQKGKIRLEGVDLKNGRPDTYRITFFGDLDLKEVLGDLKLQDLDFLDNFDLTYTSSDVKTALTSISGSGDVTVGSETFTTPTLVSLIGNSQRAFFLNVTSPVTSPSYYDATKEEVNISGGNLSTTNSAQYSGYYWKDLVYSIRLYVIIKAIEDQFDKITFSTDFFNKTNGGFYNLYMLCQRNAGKILEGLGSSYTPNKQTGKTYLNATNLHPNNLILGERIFVIYNLASYENFQFALTVNYTTSSGNIYVDLRNTSTNQTVTTFTYAVGQSGGTRSFSLGNGTYKLIFRADNNETVDTFSFDLYGNFDNFDTTSIATGDVDANFDIPTQGFSISQNIPDIKIIDFLSGLFKMFNLTAYKKDGKIYVKTLDSYYTDGTVRNITEYVDSTTKTVDKALPYREIEFKYEDTNNILAKNHLEQFQKEWGAATYNDDGTLDSNNEKYEIVLPFQHMKFEKLTTGLQVGHLLDDKQAAYLGKPVIYYPIHSSTTGQTGPSINLLSDINGYDGGTINDYEPNVDQYWIPSNTPTVLSTGSGYPESIHFNKELNEWNGSDAFSDTLFEKYYKSYITNVFRFNERLTKIKARLPLSFLQEYSLADELQIGDLTYRINSITTNLQTGESTLELLNGREAVVSSGVGSVSILISSSNSATPSTACGYTLNTTVYYTGLLGNTTQLFTDSALTTNYTGSGNYHAFPGSNYGTIDTNGYVSNYQPCPTQAPTMTTSSETNVTYQSFTMNGSLDVTNGTVTEKGFYWGTDATYSNNTKVAEGTTSSGSYQKTISSGVSANTLYYVTAYGINQHGEGIGTTISFTTPSAPIPPTVTAEPVDNLGYDSFTAELEITSDGGATINGAGFYMGTNSAAATNNPHYDITPAPTSTGTKQYDFGSAEGILANTTYYYWGTATNTYSTTKGVSSTYTTFTTDAAPSAPSVVTQTETSVTSSSFTGNINITADNGSSITSAGIWMGTNNTAYNASGNTFYSISATSTGVKSYNFTGLNSNTTYYYWGSATNSAGTTISSAYETVQTPQQVYSYNAHYNTSAFTACVQSTTTTYYSYTSTWQAGMVLYTTNTSGTLSGLAPDGNYRLNPNKYHVISGGNGTLGAEQNCNLSIKRLRITADYVSGTNFYDLTTVFGESFSTTDYLYQAGGVFGSDSLVYTDENLTTTPTYGLGTYDQDHSSDPLRIYYQSFPDQKIFAAKLQYYSTSTQQWADQNPNYTRFYQMDSSGYLKRLYWNQPNGDLYYDSNNPSTAGLTGIKITTGYTTALGACAGTAGTIVYFAGTTLGNNTVLYTDSVSAGQAKTTEKFNGSNQWYKFENNYRAQISSSGVVSNYASC